MDKNKPRRGKTVLTPEQWAAVSWLFDAAEELQREEDEREGRTAPE
ncbi:hypothetical protein K1X22_21825 [Mycolicibacterium farcinogenes]|nr:hypothetical protein [Mycolicibacterium farcinogenes]QZH58869.1 hypothetical protein K1X22_21825 [Mycolicibacterium farcinogenes]